MLKNKLNLLKTGKYKVIFRNFLSLSVLQGLNMILPLATFPYLARVLGVDYFGLLLFSAAVITYFQIICDYSFNMTATKEISLHIGDQEKLKQVFNDVLSTKILLTLGSLIILTILVLSIDMFAQYKIIYFLSAGGLIGQTLFPTWFFQGVQRMQYITYINFITRVVFTVAIFFFVKEQKDYWIVPLLNSSGFILAGIYSLYYIKRNFEINLKIQKFKQIRAQLVLGKYIFLSELKISLFTNTNVILLGFIAGNQAVSYFAAAEKLVRAVAAIQIPFSNAIFPFMAGEMRGNSVQTFRNIEKITKYGSLIFLVILTPVLIFAEEVILLLYGAEMQNSILILRILLLIPIASLIDNMYGKQILLNLNKDNLYYRVILIATIFNILMNLWLTHIYSYIGTAIALMFTQILIDVGMVYYAKREMRNYRG